MDLEVYRTIGDPEADHVVEAICTQMPGLWSSKEWKNFNLNSDIPGKQWPIGLLRLIEQSEVLPSSSQASWVEQSQKFFQKHKPLIFLCLALNSLPYCYAASKGAKVLYHSKRLRESPGKRLVDTSSFVQDVCEPSAFAPQGRAFRSILKVRLMHALTRYHLSRQPFWDSTWGVPINQEDMAGTNIAFSIVMLRGLRKLGVDVGRLESESFLHYWSVVGSLLGLRRELVPTTVKEALALERKIARRQFCKSREGTELAASLRRHVETEMKARSIILPAGALMEYLLGPKISQILRISSSSFDSGLAKSFVGFAKLQQILGFNFLWRRDKMERVSL